MFTAGVGGGVSRLVVRNAAHGSHAGDCFTASLGDGIRGRDSNLRASGARR